MHEPLVPPALVLGCNTPHGIGVLSDWIEEHTGGVPDFADAGFSNEVGLFRHETYCDYYSGYGVGVGYGYINDHFYVTRDTGCVISEDHHVSDSIVDNSSGDGRGDGSLYGYGADFGDASSAAATNGYGCGNIYGLSGGDRDGENDGDGCGFGFAFLITYHPELERFSYSTWDRLRDLFHDLRQLLFRRR